MTTHIQTNRGSSYSLCGKEIPFSETATHYEATCEECKIQWKRKQIIKMSDYMKEVLPEIDFETIKKVFKECRNFESNVRGRYCDVCMKELTQEDKGRITYMDFMYCCEQHKEYSNAFQVDRVREKLGIQVKDLPFYE